MLASSRSPALDDRAARVARTRWAFQPVIRDGVAIAAEVKAAVIWKLPLSPANEYAMDGPGPAATSVVVSPVRKTGRIRADDYPAISIRLREEGQVIFKVLIVKPEG